MGARRRGGFGNQSSQSDLEDTKGQISISSPQGPIGLDRSQAGGSPISELFRDYG